MKKKPKILKAIIGNPPPLNTVVWVTDGGGNWAKGSKNENNFWKIINDPTDFNDFGFEFWCRLDEFEFSIEEKIILFKEWFTKLND